MEAERAGSVHRKGREVEERRGGRGVRLRRMLRFLSPLIEPPRRFSRIRLSDSLHVKAHGVLGTVRCNSTPSSPETTREEKRARAPPRAPCVGASRKCAHAVEGRGGRRRCRPPSGSRGENSLFQPRNTSSSRSLTSGHWPGLARLSSKRRPRPSCRAACSRGTGSLRATTSRRCGGDAGRTCNRGSRNALGGVLERGLRLVQAEPQPRHHAARPRGAPQSDSRGSGSRSCRRRDDAGPARPSFSP